MSLIKYSGSIPLLSKQYLSSFLPVTLQDLGWNDHFQNAFDAIAKSGGFLDA